MTKVKFSKESKTEVLAYFPEEVYDQYSHNKVCYSHVGQHSSCSPLYIRGKKQAKYEEYKDLLNELIGQGYDDLIVLNKDKSGTVRSWSPIIIVIILGSIFLASCNTYKNGNGCGSYSHWEGKHTFKTR